MGAMKVNVRRLAWAVGLVAVAGVGLWATSRGSPALPADRNHAVSQAEARCLGCHDRTGGFPRPADHPLRDDCFSCHRGPDGRLVPRPGAPTSLPGGWRDDPVLAGRAASQGRRE
jgi:hypothetical protein